MRKFYLMLLANIFGYVVANAIPANPTPAKVLQPDGSYLTVCLFGDEFMHYTTTQDGYTVVKSPSGYYMYAELADGQLVASSHIARDEVARTPPTSPISTRSRRTSSPSLPLPAPPCEA